MMNSQKSDTEKINLIEEGKKQFHSYCLKCRKRNTESINLRVSETNNGKTIILSKGAKCGSKKSRFIKNQEASGISSNLGFKTP